MRGYRRKGMWHDGRLMRRVSKYGWRHGDPTKDVDDIGNPVQSNYIVVVEMGKCPQHEDDHGRLIYNPEGIPQAFTLGYGGTHYGYRTITRKARQFLQLRDPSGNWIMVDKGQTYQEITMYVVRDGCLWSSSWHLPPDRLKKITPVENNIPVNA